MNSKNKSALVQALGYGLAGAAAATLASQTANRARPNGSPLGFLFGRRRLQSPFRRTLAGALFSTPLLGNLIGGRSVKRDLLRSALLGAGAGMGSLAMPGRRGVWGARGGRAGSGLATIGRLLAGGLVAAAASRLLNRTLRDRHAEEPHTHERYANEPHTHERRSHGRQTHETPII
jgi:uncharacterized protein YoaH (UPF0181 family)